MNFFFAQMSKRAAAMSLTGGTRDVNPQYLSAQIQMSAANTITEVVLGTPIVRVGQQTNGRAVIMEVLKVYVRFPVAIYWDCTFLPVVGLLAFRTLTLTLDP